MSRDNPTRYRVCDASDNFICDLHRWEQLENFLRVVAPGRRRAFRIYRLEGREEMPVLIWPKEA